MNKLITFVISAFAVVVSSVAGQDDTLIAFSTPGPDTYSDGTGVLNGESYAVIWTKEGSTFGGLTSEGKPVSDSDRIVLVAPLAKDAHCPLTVLSISADAMSGYENGTFSLYLLDTRVKTADGKTRLADRTEAGAPATVNSVGEAATDNGDGRIAAAARVKLGSVGVYTEIEPPAITAIRIDKATVTLTVKGMSPAADYFVVPASASGVVSPALDVKPQGDTFTFPRIGEESMFKVIGTRKF